MKFFNNLDKKTLLSLLIIGFLLIAIPLTLFVSRQRQEIRKKAAIPSGTATMRLDPASTSVNIGQTTSVAVKISSTSTPDNKGISGVRAVLSYTTTAVNPPFAQITTSDISGGLPSPWTFMKEVNVNGNTVTITLNGIYLSPGTEGFDISTEKTFATINLTAQNSGTITVNFNPSLSKIIAKSGFDVDILRTPTSPAGTYTVTAISTPTLTPTVTPTPSITVIPTPTATLTTTPTPTRIPTTTVTPTATTAPTSSPTPTSAVTLTPSPTLIPGTADYTITGPSGTVNTQTNFTVIVNINTGTTSVKEAQATLSYNPTKVWWVSTTKGTFFPTLANVNAHTTAGWTLGKLVKGTGTGPSGSGSLLIFTFKAVCAATSTIQIKANPLSPLINYVYKDIPTNVNIYNGGTDSLSITATGTGSCGLPPVPTPTATITPTPTRVPTPTPTRTPSVTPTPTPGPGIINLFTGINRVKLFQFIIQFFNQFFNRSNCPILSYKNNIWKPYVADYQSTAPALTELTNSSIFSLINCGHTVNITGSGQ